MIDTMKKPKFPVDSVLRLRINDKEMCRFDT